MPTKYEKKLRRQWILSIIAILVLSIGLGVWVAHVKGDSEELDRRILCDTNNGRYVPPIRTCFRQPAIIELE